LAAVGFVFSASLSGCAPLSVAERTFAPEYEISAIAKHLDPADRAVWDMYLTTPDKVQMRNDIVSARMYAVDIAYTQYEAALTRELQLTDFGASVINAGLGVAGGIAGGETARILQIVGTGVTGVNSAYSAKVLRDQMIQNVQSAMRSARNRRAAKILANLACPAHSYTLAMALSDVESYYRAGLFHSGLIRVTRVVTKDESASQAEKDKESPARPVLAIAVTAANATEARVVAEDRNGGCPERYRGDYRAAAVPVAAPAAARAPAQAPTPAAGPAPSPAPAPAPAPAPDPARAPAQGRS
jgi:hypothetical protein